MSIVFSNRGEILIEFEIDLSSIYSENERITSPPLNCNDPDSGFEDINCGAVSSFGPPSGVETAAHEYICIYIIKKRERSLILFKNFKLYFSLGLDNLNLRE